MRDVKAIQKTLEKVSEGIIELRKGYAFRDDNEAFVLLRASFKALRDRLTPDEALHLGAQLPALLRGFYYEGWNFRPRKHIARTKEDFLGDVSFNLNGHDGIDLDRAVPAALKVILDMIDQGEAVEVLHQLPREIQDLCPE